MENNPVVISSPVDFLEVKVISAYKVKNQDGDFLTLEPGQVFTVISIDEKKNWFHISSPSGQVLLIPAANVVILDPENENNNLQSPENNSQNSSKEENNGTSKNRERHQLDMKNRISAPNLSASFHIESHHYHANSDSLQNSAQIHSRRNSHAIPPISPIPSARARISPDADSGEKTVDFSPYTRDRDNSMEDKIMRENNNNVIKRFGDKKAIILTENREKELDKFKNHRQLNRNLSAPRLLRKANSSQFIVNAKSYYNTNDNKAFQEGLNPDEMAQPDLEDIVRKVSKTNSGLTIKDRKWGTKTFKSCFVAREMVDWLISNIGLNREESITKGKKLLSFGYIEALTSGSFDCDMNYFRFIGYATPTKKKLKESKSMKKNKLSIGKSTDNLKNLVATLAASGVIGGGGGSSSSGGTPETSHKSYAPTGHDNHLVDPTSSLITPVQPKLTTPYRQMMITEKKKKSSEKKHTDSKKSPLNETWQPSPKPNKKSTLPRPDVHSLPSAKTNISHNMNRLQKKKLQKELRKRNKEREKKAKEIEIKLLQQLTGILEQAKKPAAPPIPEIKRSFIIPQLPTQMNEFNLQTLIPPS